MGMRINRKTAMRTVAFRNRWYSRVWDSPVDSAAEPYSSNRKWMLRAVAPPTKMMPVRSRGANGRTEVTPGDAVRFALTAGPPEWVMVRPVVRFASGAMSAEPKIRKMTIPINSPIIAPMATALVRLVRPPNPVFIEPDGPMFEGWCVAWLAVLIPKGLIESQR
jgi:hypothetical protein